MVPRRHRVLRAAAEPQRRVLIPMQFHYEPRVAFLLVRATGPFDAQACRGAMVCTTASEAEACGFLGFPVATCTQR